MMIGFEFDVCEYGGLGLGRSGEVCLLFGTSCNVGVYDCGLELIVLVKSVYAFSDNEIESS